MSSVKNESGNTSAAWLLLALLGFALRLTDALDFMHEQFHQEVIALTGGLVVSRAQSGIVWRGGATQAILWAGYGGEVIFYGLLSQLRRVGPFFLGVLAPLAFIMPTSLDFARLSPGALLGSELLWLAFIVLAVIRRVRVYRYLWADRDALDGSSGPQALGRQG